MSNAVKPTIFHSLQDLKLLQRELALARRLAEEAQERAAAAARLADQERRIFELSVGTIIAMPLNLRVLHHRVLPPPEPRMREADERAVMQQALSDDFDVDSLLETDESLSYRRPEISAEVVRKLRRGHWSLQAQLDTASDLQTVTSINARIGIEQNYIQTQAAQATTLQTAAQMQLAAVQAQAEQKQRQDADSLFSNTKALEP